MAMSGQQVGSIIEGGEGTIQAGFGLYDLLTLGDEPMRQDPDEIDAILGMAKERYLSGTMPGYEATKQGFSASSAANVQAAREQGRYDPARIFEGEQEQLRKLGITNANYRIGVEEKYKDALGLMASYKEHVYRDEFNKWYAQKEQGQADLLQGVDTISQSFMDFGSFGGMG